VRRLINLVGTRAVRGEHAELLRWYADHVHQLMDFPGLLGAALHRRCGTHDGAPEYLCLYDFSDREAFSAYERSEIHAAAARDRAAGWGRDGIEITLRTQFERLYWSETSAALPLATVHALRAAPQRERALAALAVERGAPSHALLRTTAAATAVADYVLIEHTADHAPPIEGFDTVWHARYERLRRWWR
jgi:heme-degrading monooxygenase HmoA